MQRWRQSRWLLQPCFVFAGEQFQHDPDFKQAKSVLLDLFRGQVVEGFNLTVTPPPSAIVNSSHLPRDPQQPAGLVLVKLQREKVS